MFSRANKSYEGTGIGLALVRKVAHRMGGKTGVESEVGRGSRFWLELRVGGRGQRPPKIEARVGSGHRAGTVLYVEDEESDALFMRRAFAKEGLESALRLVPNGRAAKEYLSGVGVYQNRSDYPAPVLVLLDLNLPEVPGFEVLKWIRGNPDYAAIPVLVFSSSTRADDKAKARELGADQFIEKPKSGTEFVAVVQELKARWLRQMAIEE